MKISSAKNHRLAAHGHKLDLAKRLSYGVHNSATNLIDERVKADELSWEISNKTGKVQYLVFSSLYDNAKNQTIFNTVDDMLAHVLPGIAADQRWAFKPGKITGAEGPPDTQLFVISKTTNRSISQFLNYIGQSPTRITKMRFESRTTAGAPDMSNFNNELKTTFFSPFGNPVESPLSLAPLLQLNQNFSPNIFTVDFINQGYELIMSNEHFTVLQINPDTVLTLNVWCGAQDSRAQRHWRTIKDADKILRGEAL